MGVNQFLVGRTYSILVKGVCFLPIFNRMVYGNIAPFFLLRYFWRFAIMPNSYEFLPTGK